MSQFEEGHFLKLGDFGWFSQTLALKYIANEKHMKRLRYAFNRVHLLGLLVPLKVFWDPKAVQN